MSFLERSEGSTRDGDPDPPASLEVFVDDILD